MLGKNVLVGLEKLKAETFALAKKKGERNGEDKRKKVVRSIGSTKSLVCKIEPPRVCRAFPFLMSYSGPNLNSLTLKNQSLHRVTKIKIG